KQHITLYDGKMPLEVYKKGILPARIELEMIRPWRQYLNEQFNNVLAITDYKGIMNWIKENIKVDKDGNYFNCPISPKGVFELRLADKRSRNIFFVAACRSVNIPAYLDNATGQIFVYDCDKWNIVSFETESKPQNTGTLVLNYTDNTEIMPQYWTHFTIAKFENGDFVTFDYENDPRVANFPITLDLEDGYYMLSTGNRYSDGETLSHLEFFNIKEGETVEKSIVLRPLKPRQDISYGKIADDTEINIDGNKVSVKDLAKEKPLVICFIDPNREPTKHTLKEFGYMKDTYEKWNGNILMVIPPENLTEPFSTSHWNLPKQTLTATDTDNVMNKILTDTKQQFRDNLPLIFIIDKDGNIVFRTEGYRIGTAELIYKSL
ncbi:MAG: transglutaminase domain-containing protein, partial [Bacteroidales bacterium]|nr:transglutaminase domain-containing protein [Bacteroidales bacterium]